MVKPSSILLAVGSILITAGLWVVVAVPVAGAIAFLVVTLQVFGSLRDMTAVAFLLGGIQGLWFYATAPRSSYNRQLCFGALSGAFLGALGFPPVFSQTHLLVARPTAAFFLAAAVAGGVVAGILSAHVLYLRFQRATPVPLVPRVAASIFLMIFLASVDFYLCWPLLDERVSVPELTREDVVALSGGNAKGSQWTGCYGYSGQTPFGLGGSSGYLKIAQMDGVLKVEDPSHALLSGGVNRNGRFWFGAEIEGEPYTHRVLWRGRFRGDSFEFEQRFTVVGIVNSLGSGPLKGTGGSGPCPLSSSRLLP